MNHNKAHIYLGTHLSISYIIAGMFFLIVTLSLLYGYFLQATIRNAVVFDQVSAKITNLHSNLSELEGVYVTETSRITPEFARSLGFTEIESGKFITRPKVSGKVLSQNEI